MNYSFIISIWVIWFASGTSIPDAIPTIVVPEIGIRHDKSDSEYLALGKKFPSVCKVGEKGGDGTLVDRYWVITAAHVAEGMFRRYGSDFEVIFEDNQKHCEIEQIFIHPEFAPMQGSDIALLRLKEPVSGILPAQLYALPDEKAKPIVIAGHGDVKTGKGGKWKMDGRKRGATNVIDEVNEDRIIFDFDAPPEGTELEGTAGPGDSGGPAFIVIDDIPYVAGVSSAGMPGKEGPGTYGAIEHYTRVSAYLGWIRNTMDNPMASKALSKESLTNRNGMRRGGSPVVRRGGEPLEGLGLMLMQEEEKIRIGGKADPLVPEAFREVMFKPPSYILSLNEAQFTSLKEFKTAYEAISKGETFLIEFEIQGKNMKFSAKKL